MLSTTGNIERAGSSEKIQPQINAKADANRSGTVDHGESISTHLRWFAFAFAAKDFPMAESDRCYRYFGTAIQAPHFARYCGV